MTSSWRIVNTGWSFPLKATVHPHRCFHLLQPRMLMLGYQCEVRLCLTLSIHPEKRRCDLCRTTRELRESENKLVRCLSFKQPHFRRLEMWHSGADVTFRVLSQKEATSHGHIYFAALFMHVPSPEPASEVRLRPASAHLNTSSAFGGLSKNRTSSVA